MTSSEFHVIIFLLLHTIVISAITTSDLTTLIYKGCANQDFQNPIVSQNLKSLFNNLVSQSSTTNFFKTTSGEENDPNDQNTPTTTTAITGLYQCRGDLSSSDCNTCVKKLPETIRKVCNSDTLAALAQLVGCYMRYEVFGFQQVPAKELLYKKCGSGQDENGSGYDETLETALSMIPKGVSNGKGYYAGEYENVYVLGQCEGDLSGGECVNCVKTAADVGRRECRSSVSGQAFLHRCYISYTFYPNGVPNAGGDGGVVSGVETGAAKIGGGGTGGNRKTEKAVAIVFGGLAGVGLVLALLFVLKSACKKKKEHHTYTYSYGNGHGNGHGNNNNNGNNHGNNNRNNHGNNNNNNNNNNSHGNNHGYGYNFGYGNGNGHGGY